MSTTLVGIFDDYTAAQKAVQELSKAGIKQGEISIAKNDGGKGYTTYGGANSKDYTTGTSIGDKISNFFDGIFGTDINDDERGVYAESVRRGSTVVVFHKFFSPQRTCLFLENIHHVLEVLLFSARAQPLTVQT
jgi:hypothetical protein